MPSSFEAEPTGHIDRGPMPHDEQIFTLGLIANGMISREDVLEAERQFGVYQPDVTLIDEPTPTIDPTAKLFDSLAVVDRDLALDFLREAVGSDVDELELIAGRLREAFYDLSRAGELEGLNLDEVAVMASDGDVIRWAALLLDKIPDRPALSDLMTEPPKK